MAVPRANFIFGQCRYDNDDDKLLQKRLVCLRIVYLSADCATRPYFPKAYVHFSVQRDVCLTNSSVREYSLC